ncbi:MAG: nucleotidyl transferase AbiEii/AbiGii toxin family protein [Alphaproteobacteria bacterium]
MLYILIMNKELGTNPQLVLTALSGKVNSFYLAGGTALSLFYFQHRKSYDVDLFTTDFSQKRAQEIVKLLEETLDAKSTLIAEQLNESTAKMLVYQLYFPNGSTCKIDFVQELIPQLKPLRNVDGIPILSLEDIYLRKIYCVSGTIAEQNIIGADIMIGGRQEAKDFYDLYCLSQTLMPLSEFANLYGTPTLKEGLIRWHKTYERLPIRTGLLDLITKTKIDPRAIELHFDKEIKHLITSEIE